MIALCFRLMTLVMLLFAQPARAEHIAASLVAESGAPAPGQTTTIALAMRPEAGWHGYWKNPGDAGLETTIEWTLPPGVTAGPLAYPVPQPLMIAGLMNYVFEGPYAHLIALAIPATMRPGASLPIRAKVRWLACTDRICVPEQAELALDLRVGDGARDAARAADFDRWRAALPRPIGVPARFAIAGGLLRVAIPLPASVAVEQPYLFTETPDVAAYAAQQRISRAGDLLIIETDAAKAARASDLRGVIAIGGGTGLSFVATPGPVPANGRPLTEGAAGVAAMLIAFGGAVLGGLLLNIMPCVFPILSLKALGLVRGGDERAARREALAYAGGAVLVCAALGGALLVLRASGSAAGWAFQLQDARVILILLLLVTAIALNLAGLFALPGLGAGSALAGRSGASGAFWTGALAAFVATPCTGPFMGAALGAALVLPAAAAMAVFVGLGIGLALPFVAIGFVPALRRLLPRPGGWMITFRRILALPMFATALGLGWILGRLAGVDAMALGLGAALLLGAVLWWIGLRQARGAGRSWWPLAPVAVALAALVVLMPASATAVRASTSGEPFSEARLAALRAERRPVFLYLTADWCLTCKVNEAAAIDRAEVRDAFARKNVAVLVGDWTRGDPAITRFLADHGRSGVPLYLYYPPGGEARTLPQVLTPGTLAALAG